MASASDDPIALWLKLGALDKLEQALLDGYGDQLRGRSSRIPQVARFLKQVPMMQVKCGPSPSCLYVRKVESRWHAEVPPASVRGLEYWQASQFRNESPSCSKLARFLLIDLIRCYKYSQM
ncbi:hypothetical protein HPB48_020712 [Haemaphysalis longicornis]|uniref:Uncharacterized protein n=1 Tax=Haemaphysalis longicornis TaxID=44386 RepID=A0A9J6G6W5_HAELO|nr:hypothetical protein HPB48_020712 [Haemaphysalis longicornis]